MDIKKTLKLANFEVPESQFAKYTQDIEEVVEYSSQTLDKVSIGDSVPYRVPLENVLGEDEPRPSLNTDLALSNTKDSKNSMFKIKAVLE